jgi:sec-independent protein translocase protein TatC
MTAIANPSPQEEDYYEGGKPLTLYEHLAELRNRLMVTAFGIAATTIFSLLFTTRVLNFLLIPGREAYPGFKPIYTEPMENVSVYFEIALILGIVFAMPIILYEIFMFVTPALTKTERRWVFPIVFGATLFFLLGVSFAYLVALKPALSFFLNFGNSFATPQIKIGKYIDFVTHLVLWTGLFFETPLVMMGLGALGIVTARTFLRWWRYAVVLGFLFAAFVIPSISPLAQTLVAAPIIGLYFFGVLLAWFVGRGRPQRQWI